MEGVGAAEAVLRAPATGTLCGVNVGADALKIGPARIEARVGRKLLRFD